MSNSMAKSGSKLPKRLGAGRGLAQKVRLQDIAEMTGVGIATVDRVLNERGSVAPQTAEKVLAMARRLKLKRILPASTAGC
jgi:LacI family transcriptional regulator